MAKAMLLKATWKKRDASVTLPASRWRVLKMRRGKPAVVLKKLKLNSAN